MRVKMTCNEAQIASLNTAVGFDLFVGVIDPASPDPENPDFLYGQCSYETDAVQVFDDLKAGGLTFSIETTLDMETAPANNQVHAHNETVNQYFLGAP